MEKTNKYQSFCTSKRSLRRTRNERHFDVQLIGGIVLHESKIAEMKTGEGKTLTITLAHLNALEEKEFILLQLMII